MQEGILEQGKVFSHVFEEKRGKKTVVKLQQGRYTLLDHSILERGYYYATFRSVEQTAMGGCGVSHG